MKKSRIHKAYLIGAGAGKAELLTLKAHKLLTTYPDVVIYDRLIAKDIIKLIPKKCLKIFAGKEPKLHYMKQDEINNEIIKYAKQGKKVIILKGGDPFIFGRGGEEIEKLKKAKIPFEVIPGITAASVAASALNIPLTYRGTSDGVIFLSGHSYENNVPDLDYKSLAKGDNTIVLYMAVGNIEVITKQLLKAGADKKTAACIVASAGHKEQKSLYSNLQNLSKDIKRSGISNPAIIIIGDVVKISVGLNSR